ncbi:MAG TPA: VOC family protein [Aggregicoccus sp.]|nr:VOC family protein [Aggregicoccus sp.]
MKTRATTLYPFVPSGPDFTASLAFFAELGFEPVWQQEDLAGLRFGGAYFMLQRIDIPVWQENQMLTFEVEDLDAYWEELEAKELPARFKGVRVKPPTDFAWGRELHIIDPGGVCWHVRQTTSP